MKKYNKKILFIIITIFLIFFLQTIAYSALNSTMKVTGTAYARIETDVRITDFEIEKTNNALSNYNEFSKNTITTGITLNSDSSSVVYSVEVSNYNSNNVGIYSISGLPEGLSYSITDYTVGSGSLIDGIGNKTFYLTISGPAGSYNISLDFDFRSIYSITYDGIAGNYQSSIMAGEDLNITFTDISNKINIFVDGTEIDRSTYSYDNSTGALSYQNINGNLVISKAESTLLEGRTFSATLKNFVNGTTDLVYNSEDSMITYIGFYENEIPDEYTKEEFLSLSSIEVSENGRIKAYNDNGKIYVYSIDDILANESMYSMFRNMYSLKNIDLLSLDTSNVTNMRCTFDGLNSLETLDLSNFNTSNVVDMGWMFRYVGVSSLDVSAFDTSNVNSMWYMFNEMTSLENLDLSNFDTSNVTSMYNMFHGCSSLINLDLSNFNTTSVTQMSNMFEGCRSLTYLDLSNFNTSNVTSMYNMFHGCSSLISLDLSNFDTSNVTHMTGMFNECQSLTSLNISNFNTSGITSLSGMFYNCAKLTSLDLSSFNTSNVTHMTEMFYNAKSLSNIYVGDGWTTENVTNFDNMFHNCTKLPNFNSNYIDKTYAYAGGDGLGYLSYLPQ